MQRKNKRAVLDVNVWISIFRSDGFRVVRSFIARNTTLLRSQELANELEEVIRYKKFKWRKPPEYYLRFFYSFTVFVPTVLVFTDCRDPKDNYLFDLAIQSQADYLVSGDDDVLVTSIPPPTKVISYTQFKELFYSPKPQLNDTQKTSEKPQEKGFLAWLKQDLAKFTDRNKK